MTRPKDISTTATSAATDDYMVLDGATNGSRKILGTNMGGKVLGPAWTDLTFGSSTTVYGKTVYTAGQTFAGAAGKRVEVEALVYKTQGSDARLGIGNGTNAVYLTAQGDDNLVPYRYSSSTETVIGSASGSNSANDYTGLYLFRIMLNIHAASNNFLHMEVNDLRFPTTHHSSFTTFDMAVTLTPFITTNDIAKCYARARLIG